MACANGLRQQSLSRCRRRPAGSSVRPAACARSWCGAAPSSASAWPRSSAPFWPPARPPRPRQSCGPRSCGQPACASSPCAPPACAWSCASQPSLSCVRRPPSWPGIVVIVVRPIAGQHALRRVGNGFRDQAAELGRAGHHLGRRRAGAVRGVEAGVADLAARTRLAAIAAAAAVRPAASISRLIAALAILSIVVSPPDPFCFRRHVLSWPWPYPNLLLHALMRNDGPQPKRFRPLSAQRSRRVKGAAAFPRRPLRT